MCSRRLCEPVRSRKYRSSASKEIPVSVRTSTIAVTIAAGVLLCASAFAQTPGAGAPPTGAAARDLPATPPPPLFIGEQWKLGKKPDGSVETDQVGVTQQNVSAASLELDLLGPSAKEIQATGIPGNK